MINNIKVKIERILDQDSTISSYFILTKMISDGNLIKSNHEKINEKSEIIVRERNLQNNARNEENYGEDEKEVKRNNEKKSKKEKNNEFQGIFINDSETEKKTENLIVKNNKFKITKEFHQFTIKLKIKRFLLDWNR